MITPKQDKFAHVYVKTGNASEAYRQAYDVKPDTKESSINSNAVRMLNNTAIMLRIKEIREKLEKKEIWNREKSLIVLARIATGQDDEARTGDKINAVKELNSMLGYNKQNIEHSVSSESAKSLADFYRDYAKSES